MCAEEVEEGQEAVQLFNTLYMHRSCYEETKDELLSAHIIQAEGVYDDQFGLPENKGFLYAPNSFSKEAVEYLESAMKVIAKTRETIHCGSLLGAHQFLNEAKKRLD